MGDEDDSISGQWFYCFKRWIEMGARVRLEVSGWILATSLCHVAGMMLRRGDYPQMAKRPNGRNMEDRWPNFSNLWTVIFPNFSPKSP